MNQNKKVKCQNCGDEHLLKDREPKKKDEETTVMVCPKCSCDGFYDI